MSYWVFKSEPEAYSFDDLMAEPKRTGCWDGIRNYQVRNMIRDEMRRGDGVLFYHSRIAEPAVVGVARIVREAYPDHTQFDESSAYHDPKSDPDDPRWLMVDIRGEGPLDEPVTLEAMRASSALEGMPLLRRGNRLSITPVTRDQWRVILKMGGWRSR